MVKYKKEKREILKAVKLTKSELEAIEEIANKDDLAIAGVIRSHALMAIRAQEPLKNLARKLTEYKKAEKEEELLQLGIEIVEDVKVLLEDFEIEF